MTRSVDDTISATLYYERLPVVVCEDHELLAHTIADRIAETIKNACETKGRCVLGLATGSTPIGVYRELIRRHEAGNLDFSRVITFNLDEYYPMAPDSIHSYRRFMQENFFDHINIPPENTHVPDGTIERSEIASYCRDYEAKIAEVGGIDFQILGIGRSGHVGFNEPGSPADSLTRLITLDTITRKDAAADFFGEANVPTEAITMGIASILAAKEIALIATGEHKAPIIRRTVEGDVSSNVTATFLQGHNNATLYLDPAAASELTRNKTPWMVQEVTWTPELVEAAVVWLAKKTKKAVLKLSAQDYRDNHLSPLLSLLGSPGAVNGRAFTRLRDKIRGRSKLPRKAKILVFSPHPDDDVISMGGILRKLVENDNQITVAYMTSGNIAVFDRFVHRHLDFIQRATSRLGIDATRFAKKRSEIENDLAGKKPAEIDTATVQDLKQFIRESEAVSAIGAIGLPPSAARFLNMPFYQTGAVKKSPIGRADIDIVKDLLNEIDPDLVFVAGDLSDPHGTHRMCKEAIDRALAETKDIRPETWLYRGAWQEWPITEADVLVSMSQEELRLKILAIFEHQSQKDTAPFPGGFDDREFWQRVESRNVDTASEADQLGLPEYYAMEAYKIVKPVP